MPRGPRLDTEGAVHHVMVRGIERRDIFLEDADREDFIERLELLVPATASSLYAWALLPNHFHLLLRSGPAGVSVFMRRLQTGYAVGFNRRHRRVGHLFQNRFKSILVEEDPYLLELVRYIHLNPVRVKLISDMRALDAYPWTGHAAILGRREASFQDTDFVLGMFGTGRESARRAYREFVKEGIAKGRQPALSGGGLIRSIGGPQKAVELRRGRERWASDERVLGSSEFVLALQEAEDRTRRTSAACRRLSPVEQHRFLQRLLERVALAFDVPVAELQAASRRRPVVEARAAFVWLGKGHAGMPTRSIAQVAGMTMVATRRLLGRGKQRLAERGIDPEALMKQCT